MPRRSRNKQRMGRRWRDGARESKWMSCPPQRKLSCLPSHHQRPILPRPRPPGRPRPFRPSQLPRRPSLTACGPCTSCRGADATSSMPTTCEELVSERCRRGPSSAAFLTTAWSGIDASLFHIGHIRTTASRSHTRSTCCSACTDAPSDPAENQTGSQQGMESEKRADDMQLV